MRQASFPLLLPLFVCKNSCSVIDVGFYLLDLCISLSEFISICHWREHSECYGDKGKTNFAYFHNYKRKTINPYYSLFKYLCRIVEIFLDLLLGDDERNNGTVKERNDPGNNCGTHFGTSPLVVSKVANGVQPVKITN